MLHDGIGKFAPTDGARKQSSSGSYATVNCGALGRLTLQLWRAISRD